MKTPKGKKATPLYTDEQMKTKLFVSEKMENKWKIAFVLTIIFLVLVITAILILWREDYIVFKDSKKVIFKK